MTGLPTLSKRFLPSSDAALSGLTASFSAERGPQAVKRVLDIAGSLIGLLALAPLLGLIALLITLDSPGGIFHRQQRLGRRGEVFELIKFRTMYRNAEQGLEQLLLDPERRAEWQHYQKLRADPRITVVGRQLRRFGLDELPQLWNVLQGRMSLVGPRPIMTDQRELYGNAYAEYVQVRPGITGLWQVSGGNLLPFASRAALDAEYIRSCSIWKDVEIVVRTVKTVLRQEGLY